MYISDLVDQFTISQVQRTVTLHILEAEVIQNMDRLSRLTSEIATSGFGTFSPSPEYMQEMLNTGNLLLELHNGVAVGFVHYSKHLEGQEIILSQSRAVRRNVQAQGVGSRLLVWACQLSDATAMTAQTQNPHELYSSYKTMHALGSTLVYPIDALYSDSERATAVLRHKMEFWHIDPAAVNMSTGARQKAFVKDTGGRLGDYIVNLNHDGVAMIDRRMLELGVDRERGDALIYVGFLR